LHLVSGSAHRQNPSAIEEYNSYSLPYKKSDRHNIQRFPSSQFFVTLQKISGKNSDVFFIGHENS
jgi:hypothetical protein